MCFNTKNHSTLFQEIKNTVIVSFCKFEIQQCSIMQIIRVS